MLSSFLFMLTASTFASVPVRNFGLFNSSQLVAVLNFEIMDKSGTILCNLRENFDIFHIYIHLLE